MDRNSFSLIMTSDATVPAQAMIKGQLGKMKTVNEATRINDSYILIFK
jgi:hypothetical protein